MHLQHMTQLRNMEPVSRRTHGSENPKTRPQNTSTTSTGPGSGSSGSGTDTAERSGDGGRNGDVGSEGSRDQSHGPVWRQRGLPGGRKLWRRLVVGFAVVASLGAVFITLGGVYFSDASDWAKKESLTMPLVLCIIAIVIGVLFICGSIILGKLIISDKWRKNQQPTYRNLALPTVRYRRPPTVSEDGQVNIQMEPPSYETALNDATSPPTNVYVISGRDINVNMTPSSADYQQPPPQYTEQTELPPPTYTESQQIQPPGGSTEPDNNHSPGGSPVPTYTESQQIQPPGGTTEPDNNHSPGGSLVPAYTEIDVTNRSPDNTPGGTTVPHTDRNLHSPGATTVPDQIIQSSERTTRNAEHCDSFAELSMADIRRVLGSRQETESSISRPPSDPEFCDTGEQGPIDPPVLSSSGEGDTSVGGKLSGASASRL